MAKLSDTQLLILSNAARRDDRNVLPLPGSLRGGARKKVIDALLSRGLIIESQTDSTAKADEALNRIWRNDDEDRAYVLHISDAGLAAINADGPEGAPQAVEDAPSPDAAPQADEGDDATPDAPSAPAKPKRPKAGGDKAPKAKKPTKRDEVIKMLRRKKGASVAEIMEVTGWQPHTTRAAISAGIGKKLGLTITSEKDEKRGRVYRIAEEG